MKNIFYFILTVLIISCNSNKNNNTTNESIILIDSLQKVNDLILAENQTLKQSLFDTQRNLDSLKTPKPKEIQIEFNKYDLKNGFIDKIIKDIRKQIFKTNDLIKEWNVDQNGYAGESQEYQIQKLNYSNSRDGHAGVGIKYSTFTFYMAYPNCLKLVHSYGISHYGGVKEYYFDDNGALIFCFIQKFEGDGYEYENEQRLYFHNNRLIHFEIRPLESNEARNYRLKNLKEEHFNIANKVLKESAFRVNWFPESFL